MAEEMTFHFAGSLADKHLMNFYEASRFQYAAARLLVKLDQFRTDGRFNQKISNKTNRQILLSAQSPGSFDISLTTPDRVSEDSFVDVPLSTLLAYISERIIGKADDKHVAAAINAHRALVERFGQVSANDAEAIERITQAILTEKELRSVLYSETLEVFERRFSEIERQAEIAGYIRQVSKIDMAREQKLISMAAPLISEMATALRRSADTLQIVTTNMGKRKGIFFLNKKMASEIETAEVDKDITFIPADIIQYNKETGWGKARLPEVQTPLSFSIPSDIKGRIQSNILANMDKQETYLQTYFVRDKAGEIVRLILIGLVTSLDGLQA